MTITVKFVGSLRGISGKSKLALRLAEAIPLRDALKKIVEESPKLEQILADCKSNMLVIINGKEISVLDGVDTVVKDGDEVVFVPILHGG